MSLERLLYREPHSYKIVAAQRAQTTLEREPVVPVQLVTPVPRTFVDEIRTYYVAQFAQSCQRFFYGSDSKSIRSVNDIVYDYNAATLINLDLLPKIRRIKELTDVSAEQLRYLYGLENERAKIVSLINRFGDRLEVEGYILSYLEHLRDLCLLPGGFFDSLVDRRIRVKIGPKDVMELADSPKFRTNGPRGWKDKKDWSHVAGGWDSEAKTAYIGKGINGSRSVALHEIGHAAGDLLDFDNSYRLQGVHRRCFHKLTEYAQQDGPGGFAGRQEFLAESIANLFKLNVNVFVDYYDFRWCFDLREMIAEYSGRISV